MSYRQAIIDEARRQGVPPEIALSVATQESGQQQFYPGGAVVERYEPHLGESSWGIFQLLESTARDLGVNPQDPNQNIQGGIAYLKQMYGATGDWSDALAAYNGGIGNWQRGTTSNRAWNYSQEVLARAGYGPATGTPNYGLPPTPEIRWWEVVASQPTGDPVFRVDSTADSFPTALILLLGLGAALVVANA